MASNAAEPICLFLAGDVMTGRGIDQVLPHPSHPALHESHMRDARDYVLLAENTNGPIPRPVSFPYIWGDALAEWQETPPAARIINLETSITRSDAYWPGKGIHYRMHPTNVACLTAAGIDCCGLANNHILDWGYDGLAETLRTLDASRVAHAGAGATAAQAAAPAVLPLPGNRRVLVFSFGSITSGIPWQWRAGEDRPGVNPLSDLSEDTAIAVAAEMARHKQPGDIAIASIHWGGNWGHDIPDQQVAFARRLVSDGVDIIHGHSSHHAKAMEVHRDR